MENCRVCGAGTAGAGDHCAKCGNTVAAEPAESPAKVAPPQFAFQNDLSGIGGWLILVAVGLGFSPFASLRGIYRDFHLLYGNAHRVLESHHGLAALILFEAVTNTIFLLSLIGLNVLFYRKKRSFPGWMITCLCGQFLVVLVDHLAATHYFPGTSLSAVERSVVGAAVWIPYYLRSQLVKQTFIN